MANYWQHLLGYFTVVNHPANRITTPAALLPARRIIRTSTTCRTLYQMFSQMCLGIYLSPSGHRVCPDLSRWLQTSFWGFLELICSTADTVCRRDTGTWTTDVKIEEHEPAVILRHHQGWKHNYSNSIVSLSHYIYIQNMQFMPGLSVYTSLQQLSALAYF